MPESAGTALAFGEFVHDLKVNLSHWHEDHLSDAIAHGDLKRGLTPVPEGDKNLALIIRVDESDQISKDNSVLVAES